MTLDEHGFDVPTDPLVESIDDLHADVVDVDERFETTGDVAHAFAKTKKALMQAKDARLDEIGGEGE